MRLSFSTRGWGDVPWDELVATAADMGFAGVEVYDVLGNARLSGKGGRYLVLTAGLLPRWSEPQVLQTTLLPPGWGGASLPAG